MSRNLNAPISDDAVSLIFLLPLLLPLFLPVVTGVVDGSEAWLLEHNVIVHAQDALVTLPGASGAGLDLVRLVVVGLAAIALTCLAILRRASRRREVGA